MPCPTRYLVSADGQTRTFTSRAAARVYRAAQKALGRAVWMRALFD